MLVTDSPSFAFVAVFVAALVEASPASLDVRVAEAGILAVLAGTTSLALLWATAHPPWGDGRMFLAAFLPCAFAVGFGGRAFGAAVGAAVYFGAVPALLLRG